jgi:hypothetical protein
MVNRVVMNMDEQGCWSIISDEPIEFFVVCDHCPGDRVYQMGVEVGVEKVRAELRDDPVGHINDDNAFGAGYSPRKPPSRRKFEVVE